MIWYRRLPLTRRSQRYKYACVVIIIIITNLAEDPVAKESGNGRERHGEQTHHDVGDGQIGDEDVGGRLQRLVVPDDVDDQRVAGHAQCKDDTVQRHEQHAQPGARHDVIAYRRRRRRRVQLLVDRRQL